jgi:hypothetical protein
MIYEKIGVVIPTIRPELFKKWLEAWGPIFDKHSRISLYLCEDRPKKEIKFPKCLDTKFEIKHYCWKDVEKDLKKDAWIIPRKCDGFRSYGFLKAYQDNCEYILTLDDDCMPGKLSHRTEEENLDPIEQYMKGFKEEYHYTAFENTMYPIWGYHSSELFPRGYPFKDRKKKSPVVQYGMWLKNPDFDGITQLQEKVGEDHFYLGEISNVPRGMGVTGCIMNAMWRADYTPLMYQLLMGEVKGTKMPFDRWGDIWSGLLVKRSLDVMHLPVAINYKALVEHTRASLLANNLKQEASGYEINETLWDKLQNHSLCTKSGGNYAMTDTIFIYLQNLNIMCGEIGKTHPEYGELLFAAGKTWCRLIKDDFKKKLAEVYQ